MLWHWRRGGEGERCLLGSLTCRVQLTNAAPFSLAAKHWYIPECSTVGEGMVSVYSSIIRSSSPSSSSPLKYQESLGSGLPATAHVNVCSTPVSTSLSSGGGTGMVAGSVGMDTGTHVTQRGSHTEFEIFAYPANGGRQPLLHHREEL